MEQRLYTTSKPSNRWCCHVNTFLSDGLGISSPPQLKEREKEIRRLVLELCSWSMMQWPRCATGLGWNESKRQAHSGRLNHRYHHQHFPGIQWFSSAKHWRCRAHVCAHAMTRGKKKRKELQDQTISHKNISMYTCVKDWTTERMSWQPSGARSGEREKRKFISAPKLCPSRHCTYWLEINVQKGERSYRVEKPRRQCLKRVVDIPVGWFRVQHAYIDVFVAWKMQSSKAVVSLADTMYRRHFILGVPPSLFPFQFTFIFWCSQIISPIQWNPTALFNSGIFPKSALSKVTALHSSCHDPCLGFFFPLWQRKRESKPQEPARECSGHPPSTTSTYRFRYRPTLKKNRIWFRVNFKPCILQRNEVGQGVKYFSW